MRSDGRVVFQWARAWWRTAVLFTGSCTACGLQAQRVAADAAKDPVQDARTRFERGDYAGADRVLQVYLRGHPDSPEALYLLAFTQQREDKPRASLETFNVAAKLLPPDGEQLRRVSLDYVLLDDYADARHWLERAVAADPKNAEAWYDLARVAMHDGRFDTAIEALHTSLRLRPGDARALGNLGKCLENQNRPEEALGAYAEAVKASEASPKPVEEPFLDDGALLNTRNRFAEALPLLERATQMAANDPHAWEELARAQSGLGKNVQAESSLERAVSLDGKNSRLHYQLARVYRANGKEAQAKDEFAKSAELYGDKSAE